MIIPMQEVWVEMSEFPNYAISDMGRIINTTTDIIKKPSQNQQGVTVVNLSHEGKQNIRSLSVLVANEFIGRLDVPEHFDTPIHLNGDRLDCRAVNLAWRPRWFAVRYHQQFRPWERKHKHGFSRPVEIIETGEIFPTSWEAAIKYGMLDQEIFIATVNRTYVFPHRYTFRELEE